MAKAKTSTKKTATESTTKKAPAKKSDAMTAPAKKTAAKKAAAKKTSATKVTVKKGTPATNDEIAARAYQIWESQGYPEGLAAEHWAQAESELNG